MIISNYDNEDLHASDNHNIISLQTKSNYDSLDILFVGNSYCYSSINTNIIDSFNISSYNLGIATAGVEFYELIINDYFNNITTPPKYVLILISIPTFSHVSDNFSSYPIHRYLEQPKSNFEIAFHFNRYDELLSMYKKSLFKGIQNIRKKKSTDIKTKKINNKGYVPSNDVVNNKVISETEYLYLSLKNDIFYESKVEHLLEIESNIESKGSKVIFFELPANIIENYYSSNYLCIIVIMVIVIIIIVVIVCLLL